MKFLVAIGITVMFSAAHGGEMVTKDYQVSKAGKDQAMLKRIFEAVAAIEAADVPKGRNFEISRKVDPKQVVVFKRVIRPGADGILTEQTDYKTAYWLILPAGVDAADGTIIKGIVTVETGETKSDLAGTYDVLKMEVNPVAPPFTRENFIFHLKAGRTWLLPQFGNEKCATCFGDGKMGALQNYRQCAVCGGVGTSVVSYRVRW